jgi:hypothetical protein
MDSGGRQALVGYGVHRPTRRRCADSVNQRFRNAHPERRGCFLAEPVRSGRRKQPLFDEAD